MIDWYTFNVWTLLVLVMVAVFACVALFVVFEEQKKLKRERAAFEADKKQARLGKRNV